MNKFYSTLIFLVSFLFPLFATCAPVRGYSIAQLRFQSASFRDSFEKGFWAFENINRINFLENYNKFQFELGLEFNQVLQKVYDSSLERNFEQRNTQYRVSGETLKLAKKNVDFYDYYILKHVDRFSFNMEWKTYNFILGRQQIEFGSSKLVNSTDILAPFALNAINTEEKNGIDALRVKKSLGDIGEWDLGLVFGEKFASKNNAAYLRLTLPLQNLSVKPIFVRYKKAEGLGLDLLTSFERTNLYLESLWTFPERVKSYNRTTIGWEYFWSEDFFSVLELHYNGDGQRRYADYDLSASSFSLKSGSNFLLSQQYINILLSYLWKNLHHFNMTAYYNTLDRSLLINPMWSYAISSDSQIMIGFYGGLGRKSSHRSDIKSEFGSYGDLLYSKYTYYF